MSEFTYPGVYIQEKPAGPGPIVGVTTSNLALIGFTPKGPINDPTLVTSYPEFESKFGTFTSDGLTPTEAFAFFSNEGRQLYVVRVTASDAEYAYWDFNYSPTTAENVSNTAEGSGIYTLQLDNTPVVAGTLDALTFENAGTPADVNVFIDDGSGNITFDSGSSGGSASGGSGSIDYETGEITVTLTDPSQFTGSTDYITADYDWTVFRFQMKWPGVMGNFFRVVIQPGDDDFLVSAQARWTRFTVLVQEDVNADATNPAWTTIETFSDMVFDDSTDVNFVATIMNDDETGSDHVQVIDYGNAMNPVALQGTAVTAEDFSATQVHSDGSSTVTPDYYNTKWKGWQYDLANGCFETTFLASFTFQEGGPLMANVAAAAGTAVIVGPDAFDTTLLPIATSSVRISVTLTTTGETDIIDDGAGNLTESSTSTVVGLINYTTGAITDPTGLIANTLDVTGVGLTDTFATSSEIRWCSGTQIGTGAVGPAATVVVTSPGNATTPAKIAAGSVRISCTLTGLGIANIVDDGAGNLDEVTTSENVGTIDYTTGQIADTSAVANQLDVSGGALADTFVAGSAVLIKLDYDEPVDVEDDGDGNLSLAATQATGYPQKFQLNANGTNSIVYATGVFTLTWKISGDPGAGPASVVSETADYYTQPSASITGTMTGGADGSALTSSDVVGASLAADEEGLYALEKVDDMAQVVISDFQTDVTTATALITYCELKKDKFALLTVPQGLTYQEAANWQKLTLNNQTSYAALYYPHIKILDPVTNVGTDIPCGGHVGGCYARTDTTTNVGEAPAGTAKGKLNWSIGLEYDLTPDQVGVLNQNKINSLVQWPHTGRCIWGALTLDIAGGEWPFIQARRLFMFVEKSVFNATHQHVFKNNGSQLWGEIRTQVTNYLLELHEQNYFAGDTADESFFVICDSSNNPQSSVDQGIVYCDVGLAPNKPAQFIVFRFSQKALSA